MKNSTINTETFYMNAITGSVDTLDGWYPYTLESADLVEVKKDAAGDWIEVVDGE